MAEKEETHDILEAELKLLLFFLDVFYCLFPQSMLCALLGLLPPL